MPSVLDHESYRHLPFVREGIFKYTPNAMVTFGFLILWVPGPVYFNLIRPFHHLVVARMARAAARELKLSVKRSI